MFPAYQLEHLLFSMCYLICFNVYRKFLIWSMKLNVRKRFFYKTTYEDYSEKTLPLYKNLISPCLHSPVLRLSGMVSIFDDCL